MDLATVLLAAGLVALGYLSGSVPFGVIVARVTGRPDPRSIGSGRTGGANAVRALGWSGGLAVGLFDIVKGAAPVLVARWVWAGVLAGAGGPSGSSTWIEVATGFAAIAGAHRSVFLRFHGGRGLAAGIGALLVLEWRALAVAAPVFLAAVAISRYVSLGSLIGTTAAVVALGVLVAVGATEPAYLAYGLAGGLLIWLAHADNIARIRAGTERRFSFSQEDEVT